MQHTFLSPAKINLFLHIVGRRADGYHLLQSVFLLINLCDEIGINLRGDGKIIRTNNVFRVPENDDLAIRAANALKNYAQTHIKNFNINNGAEIEVVKKIPMGAGLGGGSSNAATVLMALNKLWQINLDKPTLEKIGLSLGADVPFFIYGKNAVVEGVGEKFTAINIPVGKLALLVPPIHIPTIEIFKSTKLIRSHPQILPANIINTAANNPYFRGQEWQNHLQVGALDFNPKLRQYPQEWGKQWQISDIENLRMTGSGSGFFYFLQKNQLMHYNSPPFFDGEKVFFWSGESLEVHPFYSLKNC